MNINAIASNPINIPTPAQPKVEQEMKMKAPAPQPELSTKEKFAKAFYSKDEEPWKHLTYTLVTFEEDSEIKQMLPMTKEVYLEGQKGQSFIELLIQNAHYDKFKRKLDHINPELARKDFSYTLGDNAELKILDPKGNLSDEEINWLTDAINKYKGLKDSVQRHAKSMMTLIDHDTATFGGRYQVSLLTLHAIIDYGKIDISNPHLNEEWIKQINEKAEKLDTHLIDVSA
jgi:hypothetical protein